MMSVETQTWSAYRDWDCECSWATSLLIDSCVRSSRKPIKVREVDGYKETMFSGHFRATGYMKSLLPWQPEHDLYRAKSGNSPLREIGDGTKFHLHLRNCWEMIADGRGGVNLLEGRDTYRSTMFQWGPYIYIRQHVGNKNYTWWVFKKK